MKKIFICLSSLIIFSCGGLDGKYESCITMSGTRYCETIILKDDGTMTFDADCGRAEGKWEETEEGFRIYNMKMTTNFCDKTKYNGDWYESAHSAGTYCVKYGSSDFDVSCFDKW